MATHELVERLDDLDAEELDAFFDYLARELSPDPQQVLRLAQAYAERPQRGPLIALTQAAEPPRQELLRRLNRAPGGTAAILRLRRAELLTAVEPCCAALPRKPELQALESDLLHLLSSGSTPASCRCARRLELTGAAAGAADPPRGGARHRRLGRPAPPPAARPPLLRLLPPAAARRAADLRRGGAAARDAGGHRAADRQGRHAAAARPLPRGGVLQHQQLRARAARRVAGQLPDQERGRAAATRAAAHARPSARCRPSRASPPGCWPAPDFGGAAACRASRGRPRAGRARRPAARRRRPGALQHPPRTSA
jgi:hypothetical protein